MAEVLGECNIFNNLKVIEFAGELGAYAGKLFADFGADVIRIEPIGGDPTRFEKPFYKDIVSIEGSLKYQYLNTSKKGVVLDITTPEGKEAVLKLVKSADLMLESFSPGYLASMGLGYETLSAINPRLVHTAITPYGQFGPYKDYPYSNLSALAMGGMLFLEGIGDEKPAVTPDKQSAFMASLYAANASMVALYYADLTSEGQYIDVSVQDSVITAMENAIQVYDLEGYIRRTRGVMESGIGTYKCRDGYVTLSIGLGNKSRFWDSLVNWITEENVPGAELLAEDVWNNMDNVKRDKVFKDVFEKFAAVHDKQELYDESMKRNAVVYPINNAKDVLENPQLAYRKYFKQLYSETLNGTLTYPGAPCKLEKIHWELRHSAPAYGQHTNQVLSMLGYSSAEIEALAKRGVCYAL